MRIPGSLGKRYCVVLVTALTLVGTSLKAADTYVNFEGKLTRPICLSPDGTRLFAVNTADARLSVFDVSHPLNPFLIAEIPVGIEPVSVNALNNDEAWVANEESDTVSIISVTKGIVVDTLYAKDEPVDVVFAGGKAFVSESRNRQIAVFDLSSHTLLTNIVLFGENPRSLAVNSNETKIYAAFALSGNRTTIIPDIIAPRPPRIFPLPTPPKNGLIVDATDTNWAPSVIKFTMPDNDVAEIDVATMTINRYFSRLGTINLGIAVQPGSGDLFVANTDARNLVHFEPTLKGFFATNRITRVDMTSGTSTPYDLNPGFGPTNFTLANRTNALAQPAALVFEPAGTNLYVAAFGSDRIARLDPASGAVLSRIELCPTAIGSASDSRHMRGPRGLALKPAAALYVLNRISATISIIELAGETVVGEIPIGSYDPTTTVIRQGRGFLYDAKLSGNGTVSCASCHVDAEMDMLAWDLGDPGGQLLTNQVVFHLGVFLTNSSISVAHPMKGAMVTQTLRGLENLEPFHWRGDRTNFTHFNLAFTNLLGGVPLSDADMNAYRDFINTVRFEPNPNQPLDRTVPESLPGIPGNPRLGLEHFTTQGFESGMTCVKCHQLPSGSGRFIVTKDSVSGPPTFQDFKAPHLRNFYQKLDFNSAPGASSITGFGLAHDGASPDVMSFFNDRVFFGEFSLEHRTNLNAFMLCFDTGTAPAVGYTRTIAATNVNDGSLTSDWSLLEAQAAAGTNIDLIVKGTINGQRHGLLYQPGANNYQLDSTNSPPLTRAQLAAKVSAGDTITIMGVPPGSGQRMAIDRDLSGVLDADEPLPRLQIVLSAGKVVVSWPFGAAGFVLQQTASLDSPAWTDTSDAVDIVNGVNSIVKDPASTTLYFRLRQI
jgi:DNA-binding beta-propeller fold protein YncE